MVPKSTPIPIAPIQAQSEMSKGVDYNLPIIAFQPEDQLSPSQRGNGSVNIHVNTTFGKRNGAIAVAKIRMLN